jgi:Uma2 family endonuclease
MSAHAPRRMSLAEFLEWDLRQDERYELVDGEPRAMTGARVSHERVVGNVAFGLRSRLRAAGSPCDVFGADIALLVPAGNVRRPDLAVYCPPFDERVTMLEHPRLVVEVLSESTRLMDQIVKLDEYKAIPGLDYILLVAPVFREVGVWARDDTSVWQATILRGAEDAIDLTRLGVSLPLSEVYERVMIQEVTGPRLVWPETPA